MDGNFLEPEHFQNIFHRCPELLHIIANYSPFVSRKQKQLQLPSKLETLIMTAARIHSEDVAKIVFPQTLKMIDLSDNPLEDDGLEILGKNLPIGVKNIVLANQKNSSSGLINMFFQDKLPRKWVHELGSLCLNSMRVSDYFLQELSKSTMAQKIDKLELDNNLITDIGSKYLEKFKNISHLAIGQNFITRAGFNTFFASTLFKQIHSLNIKGTLGLESKYFAQNMPEQLEYLNIEHNPFAFDEFELMMNHLPNSIKTLKAFGIKANHDIVKALINNMPQHLIYLQFDFNQIESTMITNLINALPNSLQVLYLKNIKQGPPLSTNQTKIPLSFPKEIEILSFSNNDLPQEYLHTMIRAMPETITRYWFIGTKLDTKTLKILADKKLARDVAYSPDAPSLESIPVGNNMTVNMGFHNLSDWNTALKVDPIEIGLNFIKNEIHASKKRDNVTTINSPVRIKYLTFNGEELDDEHSLYYIQQDLSTVIHLQLDGTALTHKGLCNFIKKISPDAYSISFQSSSLSYEGVDEVIAALPKHVRTLKIIGLKIGEKGYQKFRDWKALREKELAYEIELTE